ncbi:hypothetical protein PIB30_073501 [Stylosanthes scabra]|uniref:Uncharacterized protein n=1 Tax=Stylosanthes scabra TaxID=79078 RepID=A0ABU6UQE6_9FABA|nr:hypothetical protein [Stylosanthes scabra]
MRSDHINSDLVRIYSMNKSTHNGYIKGRSTLPTGTSSKPYPIARIKRVPKSLFGKALPVQTHLSHKQPTFRLGISGYVGSPKPLEGTFRTLTPSVETHLNNQNGQPPPHNPIHDNRQSAFDRIGPSYPTPQPFGGTGSDESQTAQELRHGMQAMELEVRELRKENAELRSTTRNPQQRERTPPRRRLLVTMHNTQEGGELSV